MQIDYHYRMATARDQAAVQALGIISYGQHAPVLGEENWEKLRTVFANDALWHGLLQTSTCFLCTQGEEIVGMAFLLPNGNPWDIFPAEWAYIRMVGVHPQHQGKGIARKLMEQCIAEATRTGEHTLALHTSEYMNAARSLYEQLGFRVLREIPPRLGKRYWLYTLSINNLH